MSNKLVEEISIKVNIADRIYPLKIKLNEEENIRKAAKLINEQIKEYQKNYAVKDKQDLLSMFILQLATENLELKNRVYVEDNNEVIKIIDNIDNSLQKVFNGA